MMPPQNSEFMAPVGCSLIVNPLSLPELLFDLFSGDYQRRLSSIRICCGRYFYFSLFGFPCFFVATFTVAFRHFVSFGCATEFDRYRIESCCGLSTGHKLCGQWFHFNNRCCVRLKSSIDGPGSVGACGYFEHQIGVCKIVLLDCSCVEVSTLIARIQKRIINGGRSDRMVRQAMELSRSVPSRR